MAQWGEGSPLTIVPCVSLLLVLTLSRGFFSGYSGFPHSLKTNIFKFQFELASSLMLTSVYFLVTCALSTTYFMVVFATVIFVNKQIGKKLFKDQSSL